MPNGSFYRLDIKCFERSLIKRRDSGFFTFGELCRYIRRLCQRTLLPKHTPADTDWSGLLQLQLDGVRQLSSRDFLLRLKLKTDIDQACQQKAKKELSSKSDQAQAIEKLAKNIKEMFASQARSFIVNILESLLGDIRLTAHIVRGMAAFDLTVLSTQPMEQALFCFTSLFDTFQLRGWVSADSESDYRDEYVGFIDDFRNACSSLMNSPELVHDVTAFLIGMPALTARPHLFHLFRLSCMCLTEASVPLPAIKFHNVDSSDSFCRLSDVLFPAQSYLAHVPGAIPYCVTEAALTRYHLLSAKFSSGNVSGDPWSHVDSFGQISIHKELLEAHRIHGTDTEGVKKAHFELPSEASEVGNPFCSPGKSSKLAHFGKIPSLEIEKTVKELQQGSSKH